MRAKTKLVLVVLFLAMVFMLTGCSNVLFPRNAEMRFQNSTTDFSFYYGLKFGEAEFLFSESNYFSPGEVTPYSETAAGTYSVQARTANGDWITAFDGNGTVEAGGLYTIVIQGTDPNYYAGIVVDEAP